MLILLIHFVRLPIHDLFACLLSTNGCYQPYNFCIPTMVVSKNEIFSAFLFCIQIHKIYHYIFSKAVTNVRVTWEVWIVMKIRKSNLT